MYEATLKEMEQSAITQTEIRENGKVIAKYDLPEGCAAIGRSPESEIYIQSQFISRHHARIISSEVGSLIEDTDSTNGVYVSNMRVKRHVLRDGDCVSFGIYDLVYHDLRHTHTANNLVCLKEAKCLPPA